MRTLGVLRSWRAISSLCALSLLAGCATEPRTVTRTVTVEVPVPVVKPLPSELTRDCQPRVNYPDTSMTVEAIVDRLQAVEDALAICRNEKALIRALQP